MNANDIVYLPAFVLMRSKSIPTESAEARSAAEIPPDSRSSPIPLSLTVLLTWTTFGALSSWPPNIACNEQPQDYNCQCFCCAHRQRLSCQAFEAKETCTLACLSSSMFGAEHLPIEAPVLRPARIAACRSYRRPMTQHGCFALQETKGSEPNVREACGRAALYALGAASSPCRSGQQYCCNSAGQQLRLRKLRRLRWTQATQQQRNELMPVRSGVSREAPGQLC
jgi:hypothetical protein